MNNGLCSRGGQKFPYVAYSVDLKIGGLTNQVYMGAEGETIIEEDTQITGGVRAWDVISIDANGGRYMFIAKFGTNEQEFCFAVVQFKLIEGHPASNIINAGLQP